MKKKIFIVGQIICKSFMTHVSHALIFWTVHLCFMSKIWGNLKKFEDFSIDQS